MIPMKAITDTTSPLFTEEDIYIPQENKCFYCYLVSSLLTHQFNQSNDTITMKASSKYIQHSMLKSSTTFDNLLKEGSLKLYGRKIAYDFFIVENFDLTDKAMPPTRACVLKNTLKISLHFLTLADMIKTLKSQIQIMSNSAAEWFLPAANRHGHAEL